MKMTVLYAGASHPHAGWAAIDELALLMARLFDAELLSPTLQQPSLLRRLSGRQRQRFAPIQSVGGDVLFVVARSPEDLAMVNAIAQPRQRFASIHAFVTDSYHHAGYYDETGLYDSITVTAHDDLDYPRQRFGISAHHLYQGTDALQWAARAPTVRSIDVLSFGRTPQGYHQALVQALHRMDSPHLYLHSPLGNLSGPSVAVERAMLFKILHRTRISLAFHLMVEPQGGRPRSMMVTSRWLESLLGGAVVAGRRPLSRMADEMLDWQGSTVELPEDPMLAVDQLHQMLRDPVALEVQGRANTRHIIERHDWRYRIETLCSLHGWAAPKSLREELQSLKALAQSFA